MECQYCKSNFKTNSSLNNHQKTAKYCLSLQGAKSKKTFECEDCNAIFTLKSTLEKHQTRCVYNLPDIKKLKQQLIILRQQVISLQSDKLSLQSDKLSLQ